MEKKTKIIVPTIVVAIIVIAISIFIVLQGQEDDPLSNLGYVNREYGFGLNPPESWTRDEWENPPTAIRVVFSYPVSNNSTEDIYFSIGAHLPDIKETGALNTAVEGLLNRVDMYNFSLYSHNERTINGMNAYEFVWGINESDQKGKWIYVEKNERLIQLEIEGTIDLYDQYSSIAEQSINTLVIL